MSLPERIAGRPVTGTRRAGGGDINEAWLVELEGGMRAFVKTRDDPGEGEYEAEAAALRWLGAGGAPVPRVLEAADGFLALEWIDGGVLDAAGEERLGRCLARTHRAGAERFGAVAPRSPRPDTRLGPLLLPNDPASDWPAFYAERRLLPLVGPAMDRGALSRHGAEAVERVCERIAELAGPPEPPARLHGDLWSGNVHPGVDGMPHLIDPAAYGGHREIDLAMLTLFGGPGPRFLAAYEEVSPLADGHAERTQLWQLFPLLVHAVLFGGSYGASVERAARAYS